MCCHVIFRLPGICIESTVPSWRVFVRPLCASLVYSYIIGISCLHLVVGVTVWLRGCACGCGKGKLGRERMCDLWVSERWLTDCASIPCVCENVCDYKQDVWLVRELFISWFTLRGANSLHTHTLLSLTPHTFFLSLFTFTTPTSTPSHHTVTPTTRCKQLIPII